MAHRHKELKYQHLVNLLHHDLVEKVGCADHVFVLINPEKSKEEICILQRRLSEALDEGKDTIHCGLIDIRNNFYRPTKSFTPYRIKKEFESRGPLDAVNPFIAHAQEIVGYIKTMEQNDE